MRPHAFVVSILALLVSAAGVSASCLSDVDPVMPLRDVKLVMTGFATEKVDDSFRFEAVLAPGATFDPAATGLSFELSNQYVGPFATAEVPGGIGWRARGRGGLSYSDPDGTHGGVTRIKVKTLADGTLSVSIAGRRQPYALSTGIRPIRVTIGPGTETPGAECGVAFLAYSRCEFQGAANVLRCTPPPSWRRCGDDPDARVRCDALNAAAAQETYYVSHGEYFGGECAALPGFTPSPETICVAAANEMTFALVTGGPSATVTCTYESAPDMDQPNLVCS
jgi:hypothetical protein